MLFEAPARKQLELFVKYLFSEQSILLNKQMLCNKKSLEQFVMDQVLVALGSASIPDSNNTLGLAARRRSINVFSRAHEYIKASYENQSCPSIIDICHELKVSQRTLQYSFKMLLGLTPNSYLRILRLNWARKQLRNPASNETTITEVATRWGFWHLGKFSSDYMTMFGELPSTTLKRALY